MKFTTKGAAAAALLLLAGCGGNDAPQGQPSAEEREALDNIAAKADAEAETFDTSADSLVPAEGSVAASNQASDDAAVEGANASSPDGAEEAPPR